MNRFVFKAKLEQDKDGTWWYVHVPKEVRDSLKHLERHGIIHVRVAIGRASWDGSMLPWADGSAQVSVNKSVRSRENLGLGQQLEVTLEPR